VRELRDAVGLLFARVDAVSSAERDKGGRLNLREWDGVTRDVAPLPLFGRGRQCVTGFILHPTRDNQVFELNIRLREGGVRKAMLIYRWSSPLPDSYAARALRLVDVAAPETVLANGFVVQEHKPFKTIIDARVQKDPVLSEPDKIKVFAHSLARAAAVKNILGFRRHADDILIDHNTGEAIPIDFEHTIGHYGEEKLGLVGEHLLDALKLTDASNEMVYLLYCPPLRMPAAREPVTAEFERGVCDGQRILREKARELDDIVVAAVADPKTGLDDKHLKNYRRLTKMSLSLSPKDIMQSYVRIYRPGEILPK
jgi:hypothetical protein